MYEKRGERHAWVNRDVEFLDHLSYLSVKIYLNFYNNLWTNICKAEGKLVSHILAKEVLYYFDLSFFINS